LITFCIQLVQQWTGASSMSSDNSPQCASWTWRFHWSYLWANQKHFWSL